MRSIWHVLVTFLLPFEVVTSSSSYVKRALTWQAAMITADNVTQAPLLRKQFQLDTGHGSVASAVLHVSALGIVEPFLDGEHVSEDLFTPGWSSYEWRLRYVSHNVTSTITNGTEHVLGLALGNGWARGRLTWTGGGQYYTKDLGGFAQLEVSFEDDHVQTIVTDTTWQAHASAVLSDDLYDGQSIDAAQLGMSWATNKGAADTSGWSGVHALTFDTGRLTEHIAPPVRRHEVLPAQKIWASPSGKTLVDFGQNLVGWVRFRVSGPAGHNITLHHAEVLENGELGLRPLRTAKATDTFILSGNGEDVFEPTFTFHGFRYAQVDNWPGELKTSDLEGVVVHTDLERTGTFESSHELLTQLHRNIVWGQKGNFLDVPTDCPQRDERLGWTGDLSVFSPSAVFLFDSQEFLRDWLRSLAYEQKFHNGTVPFVIPDILKYADTSQGTPPTAIWGDSSAWVPWAAWNAYGNRDALAEAYPAMAAHVERVEQALSPSGLWDTGFQFGDWLDPDAPPEDAGAAKANKSVVATASYYRSASTVVKAAQVLGLDADADRFSTLAERIRSAFLTNYVSDNGTVLSDCATVYALAIQFGILDGELRQKAGDRLAVVVADADYRISTGFAGTPYVTDALTVTGHLDVAYRLLLQTEVPSWLYPVTMGATTIWERWDSMLPDGSINPGSMTSFNHYALGAVADWLHRTVAGLAPLEPGYARSLIAPQPGGGLTWARGSLKTLHGRLAVDWQIEGETLNVKATVPEGTAAVLRLPGVQDRELTAGEHSVSVPWVE